MTNLVALYNPANAAALTPEQIQGLQQLTSAQIRELALAYPNSVMQKAYLLMIDSSLAAHRQLPQLTTFENLWNLRERNGQRNWVAFQFKGVYKPVAPQRVAVTKKPEVLDLSDTELLTLPGFKAGEVQVGEEKLKVTRRTKKTKLTT